MLLYYTLLFNHIWLLYRNVRLIFCKTLEKNINAIILHNMHLKTIYSIAVNYIK